MYQYCTPQYLCGFLRVAGSTRAEYKHKIALFPEKSRFLANRAFSFLGICGRFKSFSGRFAGICGRFEDLCGRFEGFSGRFKGILGRFESFNGRLLFEKSPIVEFLTVLNPKRQAFFYFFANFNIIFFLDYFVLRHAFIKFFQTCCHTSYRGRC